MQTPKRKSEQTRRYNDDDNYLTPEKIQELKNELERLEQQIRPKVVEDLTAAREMNNLSENAAYSYAKGRLAGIDRRLFEINEKLKNAIVIQRGAGENGAVCIGSTVTVRINNQERIFEITGSQETDPGSGRISHRSPVGSALLGHIIGDIVQIKITDHKVDYEIIKII
ncbi:transcription elongation factor GreA [Patescibacteria group bacterium]|nr:transcription elongation factor GreA [Patescibacteria group bacterium]